MAVQPHACGEKVPIEQQWLFCHGSTPRMWGKVSDIQLVIYNLRFNPTHVGKSTVYASSACGIAVQPHACGEKTKNLYRALRYYVSLELTYSVSQNLPSDP